MIKYPLNVTIDTNIFVSNKFNFREDSTMNLLVKYVKQNKIKVILSDIVVREVEKHIVGAGNDVCTLIKKARKTALKKVSQNFIQGIELDYILEEDPDAVRKKCITLLSQFLDDVGAEILKTSTIDLEPIMNDYFNFNWPFEDKDKKRKEFPDAFIAAQIKERFGDDEVVAIVSDDEGFKKACQNWGNHMFFSTLGELYNAMNKEEQEYSIALDKIKEQEKYIIQHVKRCLKHEECVDVIGISHDKDNIIYGYDYNDITIKNVSNISFTIHTIDEISSDKIVATLLIKADIDVICSYEDYENAAWDSETHEYIYVQTKLNLEEHSARFGCRVEVNRENDNIRIIPFKAILNSDSRKDIIEIEEDEYDYEQEIIDADRKNVGLQPLGNYDEYLEDEYIDSKMKQKFEELFNKVNDVYSSYETISSAYDILIDAIANNREHARETILLLSKVIEGKNSFPLENEIEEITDENIEQIRIWAENNYNRVAELADKACLPDSIYYGETISFSDEENEYTLSMDKLEGNLSEGEEVTIDIILRKNFNDVLAKGYVALTVGYINIDDDGGVSDGVADNIKYNYNKVVEEFESIIGALQVKANKEYAVSEIIRGVFEDN